MRRLLSRSRVAAVSPGRLAPIALGLCVAGLVAIRALGAEPGAPATVDAPSASDALVLVGQRLVPFQTLLGRFEQEKRIAKIKRPLSSRGRFALVRGKGVLWRTEAPIQSLLTLTADTLSVAQGDRQSVSLSLGAQPGLRFLGQTVFAVFMTDVLQIRRSFSLIDGVVPDRPLPWRLSLKPRDAAVAKLMREIQLTGGEQIESVEIFERNGDSTMIRLLELDSRSPLALEDARLLERALGRP
jgi:outer membrane lipoprotein carrier protein LolA